jgi:hypothetical protein
MGGEEFAVVMPETDLDAGHRIAERLRSRIAGAPVENIAVTVSIGAAMVQLDMEEEELDAALRRADEALYEAKRAGRNRVMADGLLMSAVPPEHLDLPDHQAGGGSRGISPARMRPSLLPLTPTMVIEDPT